MISGRAIARAHTNIALAKYWGKRDEARNIPATPSLSAGLDALWVEAEVMFTGDPGQDSLVINGQVVTQDELARVTTFLDLVRERAAFPTGAAEVSTRSNFPKAAGLASSAAAFAALATAASDALGLSLGLSELSALARRGSGSAARSLFDGYVELGTSGDEPHATQLAPAEHFPLGVAVAVTSHAEKSMSSRSAMRLAAETSPYYSSWVESAPSDLKAIRDALLERRFQRLAERVELNCLKMHAVSMASTPPVLFWTADTLNIIQQIPKLRADGLKAFFTIDAGPNVVIFFDPVAEESVIDMLCELDVEILMTRVGGALERAVSTPAVSETGSES